MWTPKRVILLVGSFAVFLAAYRIYAYFLGGIDGLPPLPAAYHPAEGGGPEIIVSPDNFIDRKLRLAFGEECPELLFPIKLEVHAKGIVLASADFVIEKGGKREGQVRLSPISVALFSKKTPAGKHPEITTVRGAVAYLTFDRPVTGLPDLDKRRIVGCELIGRVKAEDRNRDNPDTGTGIIVVHNRGTPGRDDDLSVYVPRGPVYYREYRPPKPGAERKPEIWTDDAVELTDLSTKPEPSTVKATGLDIYLTNDPQAARTSAPARRPRSDAVTGVERVVLRSAVEMHLFIDSRSGFLASGKGEPAQRSSAPLSPAAGGRGAAGPPSQKSHLVITTQGPFQYDMIKDLATFDIPATPGGRSPEQILVSRYQEQDKPDQLVCEHLELQFRRKPAGPRPLTPSPSPPAGGRGVGGEGGGPLPAEADRERTSSLEIETAHATGRQVILTSDVELLEAHGDDFFYDARTQLTTLKGNPEMWALKEGNEIHARELQILNQQGAQQGTALGPGRIDLLDKQTGKRTLHARWRDKLVTSRDGKHDLLTLTGDAAFLDDEQGQELRAEVLKVWLEPSERPATPPSPLPPLPPQGERGVSSPPLAPSGGRGVGGEGATSSPLAPAAGEKGVSSPPLAPSGGRGVGGEGAGESRAPSQGRRPHHLEAIGRVQARSRELTIHDTDRLVLWFKDAPAAMSAPAGPPTVEDQAAAAAPPAGPPTAGTDPRPIPPASNPAAAPIPPRSAAASGQRQLAGAAAPAKSTDPIKPSRPIDLSARLVEAHILRSGDKNELDRLWTEGAVRVRQEGATPADRGVDIQGDTLQLTRTPEGNLLVVTGDLAQLRLDKLFILGPEVNIDQAANKAWVNRTGAMQLETDKNFQGTKLKEPVPLTIHWNESMFFNGQFAEFRGGIQAEQENARLACQYLQVELDRPVSLKQGEKRDSPPAKVDRLVCDGSVRVEEAVLDAGSLVKYQRLESPSVAVDNAAGTVHASGPGLVRLLQPGAAEGPALPGSRPVAGRSAAVTGKPTEPVLKLTWVRFFGSMYANNKNHTATFRQNVEVVHLPSDDPNLEPNVDKLPEGGMYIRADVLTVYSRGNAERGSQEMEARGNVLVRANEFWARADEVHYNEAKDQVILKANLGSVVSLYRRTAEGGAWQESRSKEVIYSRKTGKFDLIGGRGVQGGN